MKVVWMMGVAAAALFFSACKRERGEVLLREPMVRTAVAAAYGEHLRVSFPGRVKAAEDVNLAFRVAGTIAKIRVAEGRRVRKGEVLAELDARDYVLQLQATEAEYRQVKAEAERIISLYEKEGVAANDYDKAVYGLRQITAKYEAHRHAVEDTRLCAPFDGYVQQRFFSENETVGAGTPVASMIGMGAPEVEIHIPLSDYVRRGEFESFVCRADVYPGREFPLELISVVQKANLSQLYAVRLRMREGKQLPAAGMAAMVEIRYKAGGAALAAIPYSAVFERNGVSTVWVYEEGTQTVAAREVEVSELKNEGTVVVSNGLRAGETVVTAGVHSLHEGGRVKLLPQASATNVGGLL
jgi:RND family efflux transporter MFP subunit